LTRKITRIYKEMQDPNTTTPIAGQQLETPRFQNLLLHYSTISQRFQSLRAISEFEFNFMLSSSNADTTNDFRNTLLCFN
jgi:hypothetical protein